MKTIFIVYDQAHQDNVVEALNDSNVRGYSFFEQVGGRGTKTGEPHLGSHAWPSMNSSIIWYILPVSLMLWSPHLSSQLPLSRCRSSQEITSGT